MVAVTTEERVLVVRRRFELLCSMNRWESTEALDRILAEVSRLPHSASRVTLENDILDLRLTTERGCEVG